MRKRNEDGLLNSIEQDKENKMYITRLLIDKRTWYRYNLDNPNAHKGMLWHLFAHHNLPYNSGGFVFRVEKRNENFAIFVLSKLDPKSDELKNDRISVDIKMIPDTIFTNGSRYFFKTRVNPVRFLNGKRVPKDSNDVPDWIAKQMEKAAKCICKVENVGVQVSYKNGQVLTHHSVDVRGLVEIINSNAFIDLLTNGIGRARRYGFGLIALNI